MKKIFVIALTLVLSISPVVLAKAAENQYYLVEGYVTPDGGGEITRIELVDDVAAVKVTPGTEYAISTCDSGGAVTGNTAFGVSFETAPDLPFAQLDQARFAVLVPYSEEISEFKLVDRQGRTLSSAAIVTRQEAITAFDVEDTGSGFVLRWAVACEDFSVLEFDIYAVSQLSGEKNVLAYHFEEWELAVPYDWLEPDDTIIFVLKSNDGRSTLTAESESFNTPPGESKDILDDEAWEGEWSNEEEEDSEWYIYLILIFLFVLLPVAFIVLVIVLVKKRKKRKLAK